jgi:hypothetical protein
MDLRGDAPPEIVFSMCATSLCRERGAESMASINEPGLSSKRSIEMIPFLMVEVTRAPKLLVWRGVLPKCKSDAEIYLAMI